MAVCVTVTTETIASSSSVGSTNKLDAERAPSKYDTSKHIFSETTPRTEKEFPPDFY